jgi:hypothetical protein
MTTENQISRQEWQLLELVRSGAGSPEFKVMIRHHGSEWLVETSSFPHSDNCKARGFGETFARAWDALDVLAVAPLAPPRLPPR